MGLIDRLIDYVWQRWEQHKDQVKADYYASICPDEVSVDGS